MNLCERQRIAEELLGGALDGIYARCPGQARHTHGNGHKDFQVRLDGAPTGYCVHRSCADAVADFNLQLRRGIWFAENGRTPAPTGHWADGVSAEPKTDKKKKYPDLDMVRVADFIRGVPEVDEAWLARRSPVEVAGMDSGQFLDALYEPGERVLVFTSEFSQGDFLWWAGKGGYRLARQRGVKAVRSKLPMGGEKGVWFLVQPVTGTWSIKPAEGDKDGDWTRRSKQCVTDWRYYVLESDELDFATWLKVVVNLPFPICAIYTSGKRSIHTLMKLPVESKAVWDATRDVVRQIVCPLGADPAALSAVRLSRLPGCRRGNDGSQKLLFLNPEPDHKEIRLLPEVRE